MKKTKLPNLKKNNAVRQRVLRMRKLITAQEVAEVVGCSPDLVLRVLRDERTDRRGIWATADKIISSKIKGNAA